MSSSVTAIAIYLSLVVVMSVISFAVYGLDKQRAVTGGRRIRERSFHVLAFLGGWPGAVLAQRRFRHKTRKLSFLIAFWFVVILHVGLVVITGYLVFGPSDPN